MPLTQAGIKALAAKDSDYLVTDGNSLYILVTKAGGRLWRFRYRFLGKQKQLSLGAFPEVPLAAARLARDDAKRLLAAGIDPGAEKQRTKAEAAAEALPPASSRPSFLDVAQALIALKRRNGAAPATLERAAWTLTSLGDTIQAAPIDTLTRIDIVTRLRIFEATGHNDKVQRMRGFARAVFDYAIDEGHIEINPANNIRNLTTPRVKRHAAILDKALFGTFLRAIDGMTAIPSVYYALQLAPHVFLRSHEIRELTWDRIDMEARQIRIKGTHMRKSLTRGQDGLDHIVPLTGQTIAILRNVLSWSGPGAGRPANGRVFPGQTKGRPISENTFNAAFRRLGFDKDTVCFHGLRTTASTWLNEDGWNSDWIERQLSHVDRNNVRAAYNAAQYLDDRRRMMQAWSDMVDAARTVDNA